MQTESSSVINVTESNNVSLTCLATYYGSWVPNVSWLLQNGAEESWSKNYTSLYNNNTAYYTYDLINVSRTFQNYSFTCSMSYDAPPKWLLQTLDAPEEYDQKAPNFTTFCDITLNVQCKSSFKVVHNE